MYSIIGLCSFPGVSPYAAELVFRYIMRQGAIPGVYSYIEKIKELICYKPPFMRISEDLSVCHPLLLCSFNDRNYLVFFTVSTEMSPVAIFSSGTVISEAYSPLHNFPPFHPCIQYQVDL